MPLYVLWYKRIHNQLKLWGIEKKKKIVRLQPAGCRFRNKEKAEEDKEEGRKKERKKEKEPTGRRPKKKNNLETTPISSFM